MIRGSAHSLQHRLPGRRRSATTPFLFMSALLLTILAAAWPSDVARSAMPGQERDPRERQAPAGGGLRVSPAPCEVRVELGRKGAERLWLAARLREGGGLIRRPVAWKVRRLDPLTGTHVETVAEALVDVAEFRVPKGEYLVEAIYGFRRSARRVHVGEGEYVAMTFILDVGGLRPHGPPRLCCGRHGPRPPRHRQCRAGPAAASRQGRVSRGKPFPAGQRPRRQPRTHPSRHSQFTGNPGGQNMIGIMLEGPVP